MHENHKLDHEIVSNQLILFRDTQKSWMKKTKKILFKKTNNSKEILPSYHKSIDLKDNLQKSEFAKTFYKRTIERAREFEHERKVSNVKEFQPQFPQIYGGKKKQDSLQMNQSNEKSLKLTNYDEKNQTLHRLRKNKQKQGIHYLIKNKGTQIAMQRRHFKFDDAKSYEIAEVKYKRKNMSVQLKRKYPGNQNHPQKPQEWPMRNFLLKANRKTISPEKKTNNHSFRKIILKKKLLKNEEKNEEVEIEEVNPWELTEDQVDSLD